MKSNIYPELRAARRLKAQQKYLYLFASFIAGYLTSLALVFWFFTSLIK